MIKNNSFYVQNLKNICIFGGNYSLEEIKKINDQNNINTFVICTKQQNIFAKVHWFFCKNI